MYATEVTDGESTQQKPSDYSRITPTIVTVIFRTATERVK